MSNADFLYVTRYPILLSSGRLSNADFLYMTMARYPILLSSGYPLTALVVKEAQSPEQVCHNSVKETLYNTAKLWIPICHVKDDPAST